MKETGLLPSRFTFYRGKDRKQSQAWGEPQRKAGCGWRVRERHQARSPQGGAGGAEICKSEGQAMWLSGDVSQAMMAGAKALWQSVVGLFREQ